MAMRVTPENPARVSLKKFLSGRVSLRGMSRTHRASVKAELAGAKRTPRTERNCQGRASEAFVIPPAAPPLYAQHT